MSRIAVTFPDAMASVLAILRPVMPTIRFGTIPPEDLTEPTVPYVMVRLDGTFTEYPVNETATIRLAIWHRTEAEGIALAQTIRAVLCSFPGGAQVRSIRPLTGPLPTNDPDTGSPLSSITVAVRLRPTSL